jgi:hypothetical protein
MGIEWRRLESSQHWRVLPHVGQDVTPHQWRKTAEKDLPF